MMTRLCCFLQAVEWGICEGHLTGFDLRVGQGRYQQDWLGERLAARVRDARVLLAPPHGLVLESVEYPADHELAARAEQTRARRPGG